MIEKGKISATQMGIMLYLAVTPTAILTTPSITYQFAKQDSWISPFWAVGGLVAALAAIGLHRRYPKMNLVQASERIVGKIPGKLLAVLFSFYFLYINSLIVREYSDFVVGATLERTPPFVVAGSMVLVCAIAVRGGVEVVGRFAQLFLPVFLAFFLLIVLSAIPDLEPLNLLPVMGEGVWPSIKGSYVLQSWFGEFIIASYLLPFVTERAKEVNKSLFAALLAVILTMAVTNLTAVMLLGEITGNFTYPLLIMVRYIQLAEFFTHVSSLFMAIWVFGTFVKICVFHYVTAIGIAQWMNLSDFRPVVLPLGFLLVVLSIWTAPSHQELTHAIATSVTVLTLFIFVLIPAALAVLALLRKKR